MESVWDSFHFIAHEYLLSKIMRVQLIPERKHVGATYVFTAFRGFRNYLARLKKLGDAFFHDQYSILNSSGFGLFFQESEWFLHGFVREAEGSVVHGDHPPRIKVKKGAGS